VQSQSWETGWLYTLVRELTSILVAVCGSACSTV
jgi:hypothetical protein